MIRVLEKKVADKIAAGEVVDRPVSIVKELLENSIDAGADSITVEIKNGGKSYIRVTDNGCGIDAGETALAFTRHATSKITEASDLDAISTLGFRGEALASICAVARVELVTKTPQAKLGHRILAEGSEIIESTGTGCPDGTTITVKDLFYNVPARQKFLSSDSGEARRITDLVSRIALSYGDIRISLINGSKRVFSTQGRGNILNSIVAVYGNDTAKDLLPVDSSRDGYMIRGFVSPPSDSLSSRSRQIFCVNGRVVSSRVLEKALDEAYREKMFQGRFPLAFLFLAMPPEKLDVNIHPTKKEVRFDDDFEVMDFVQKAIVRALSVKAAIPEVTSEQKAVETIGAEGAARESADVACRPGSELPEREKAEDTEQVDINKLLSELRRKKEQEDAEAYIPAEMTKTLAPTHRIPSEGISAAEHGPAVMEPEAALYRPFDIDSLDTVTSVFNTYIIATDSDSMYLIDQHAAHERIMYEKLLAQYNSSEKIRQQLLIPLNFNISAQVAGSEDSWHDALLAIGYDVENFGGRNYLVRAIPAFMSMEEAESFLADVFASLEDKPDLTNTKILERIIMRSCKSAVKGGDILKKEEIDALMDSLKKCVNPFSCPHGRPTFIRMTEYEIRKMFRRV